jgi:predicted RNA-binding Zn ribbon-like protein
MVDPSDLIAGALCLDFVNTVGGIRSGVHDDKLERYEDLLEWAVLGKAITRAQADSLALIARRRPDAAVKTLGDAKGLREALHAVFSAELKQRPPAKPVLDFVNQRIGQGLSHLRVRREAGEYAWSWEPPEMLDAPLWPVAHDAGEFLVGGSFERLQECASETCGWFFLDQTKNHSRRWCAMSGCGNRHKVRRYRDRLA